MAERTFLELIEQATVRGDGCVRVEPLVPIPARTCISLMSYNFYGFHAYPARMANICRVITKYLPDVPSKFVDSAYYRHFSYAELEDRVTGARFLAVNLHLQRTKAVEQMQIVFEHLNRCFNDLPVFLIGDLNSEADKPVLYQMREIAGFASAHDTAKKIRGRHNRIDWILYTKDCAEATFYHCCTETYPDPEDKKGYYNGRTPSDHFAFYAEVELTKQMEIRHDWSSAAQWKPAPVEE